MKNIPIHRKYLNMEISFKVYTFYGPLDKNIPKSKKQTLEIDLCLYCKSFDIIWSNFR